MGAALDALMDLAKDLERPPVTWGRKTHTSKGETIRLHWVALQLDGHTVEHEGRTRDQAAWLVAHDVLPPDPDDVG